MPLHLDVGVEPVPGYALVRLLGRGGFGEVWEALAPGGVRVALKFIRLGTTEAGSEQRALEVIRDIRHPHLLDVQFAVRVEDCLVIAMPLCDESLMDRLHACRAKGHPGVPRDELLGYMDELARAVDFLNEPRHKTSDGGLVGVQHRDIKPHNIFLVGGSARLADFGLAKVLEATSASHTGAMSPHYVAPEVIEGRVSRWSDQYSLAVTYAQLRTGRRPFAGDAIPQVFYKHLHEPPDLSGLPEEERQVVARALAKQPEDRWPTCRAFVLGLQAAAVAEDRRLASLSGETLIPGVPSVRPEELDTDAATEPPSTQPMVPDTRAPEHEPPPADTVGEEAVARQGSRRWIRAALAASLVVLLALVAMTLIPGIGRIGRNGPATKKDEGAIAEPSRTDASRLAEDVASASKRGDGTKAKPVPTPPHDQPPVVSQEPSPATPPTPVALSPRRAADPDRALADQAHALLKKYCYRCHGVRFEVPGYNVLDRDILVAKRGEDDPPYVVPGKPEESYLWERVGVDKDMPPSGPKPSDEERKLIERWILAGAPFPIADLVTRPIKTEKDVLAAIRDHLRHVREGDRAFLRYFTLHNLHNDRSLGDDDLRLARAAVAKLVNSLSWKPEIVVPEAIDPAQTVLAIDLRDVGWDERHLFDEILGRYPYGLKHDKDRDEPTRALAAEVYTLSGSSMPYVRADWFVATASRPPLYHTLLDLPKEARALERLLKVDVEADFLNDKLARAGFATSGISSQNRLVDRHVALYGAYWKSYDFKRNEGTGNLFRFPLGPVFADNPFSRQAFEHAGGEILFNLPNGLQGYLLVDAKGNRIDAGPIEVVGDALKTSGTAAIVTGLSCMACHQRGMIPFKDTIREGLAVAGAARDKVERLFPEKAAMDKLLGRDEARFLKALDEATGPFLKVGDDRDKDIRDFAEPIGAVARAYLKDLGPAEVAGELGLGDLKDLTTRIQANPRLRQLGLAPLLQGAAIKRTEWDSLEGRFISTFQEVARELELGTPFRSF